MEENGKEEKNSGQMVCTHCGCELPNDALLCPKCGKEIVQVSSADILEEEFLQEIVDEESHNGDAEAEEEPTSAADTEPVDEEGVYDTASQDGNKKRRRNLILVIIIVAAIVAAIIGVRLYQTHSTNYLLRRAQREYNQRDYEDALGYLDKLFALDPDNEEGLVLAGEVYAALGDYDAAEEAFLEAIEINPDSVEAYKGLLELYDAEGNTSKIIALKQNVTNEEILALFDDYLIPAPEILTEGGTFDDTFTVELTTNYKGAVIYYTLDGTTPTDRSFRYTEPVRITDEGTTVLTAVIMNDEGEYSEPVSETYVIEFPVPEDPVATPAGGEFTTETTVEVEVPENSVVYYTWDNKTPTENSSLYTDPIVVPEGNNVLSLIAINQWGKMSDVQRYNYIYYPQTSVQTIENTDTDTRSTSTESTGTINGVQPQVSTPESTTADEDTSTQETTSTDTNTTTTEEPPEEQPQTADEPTEPETKGEEHDE